jgi:hypothetical protein
VRGEVYGGDDDDASEWERRLGCDGWGGNRVTGRIGTRDAQNNIAHRI